MYRLQRLNLKQNLWESSSDEDDTETNITHSPVLSTTATNNINRLSLLAAFPSLHQHGVAVYRGCEHLLMANVPAHRLTNEQQRQRKRSTFSPSFTLTDHRQQTNQIPSFFLTLYEQLFTDLVRRLHIDDILLDYNYKRLFKCIHIMTNERIQYRFQTQPITICEPLPVNEYGIALEFYLQFDVKLFYMKTCSFRGARPNRSVQQHGLFCFTEPQAYYGMVACHQRTCRFCFPVPEIQAIRLQPVVRFLPTQKHRFVSGYEAILNCPTFCETKNIIYTLTCPCGQFDYIGYTSMTLSRRLSYHRKHGNRIMREFLLGPANVHRLDQQKKSHEDLVKDGMRLYRHSARCSRAMQWFLDCNPHYWCFVPMTKEQAQSDNQFYVLPSSIPADPSSPLVTALHRRSDLETGFCLTDLPPLPSDQYTFSTRQCVEQFQTFQNERNRLMPNYDLDLYNATIVAVLPENSSGPLQRTIEALFITHAETKLNTIGHLDGSVMNNNFNPHGVTPTTIIADRGDWCRNLVRRSSSTLSF